MIKNKVAQIVFVVNYHIVLGLIKILVHYVRDKVDFKRILWLERVNFNFIVSSERAIKGKVIKLEIFQFTTLKHVSDYKCCLVRHTWQIGAGLEVRVTLLCTPRQGIIQ